MADNDSDIGAFLSGFIMGGLVGAAAALIMAPQSGEDTRAQIRDRSLELRDRADTEVQQIRVRAEQSITDMRTQAEEMQQRSKEMIDETRNRVTTAIEQGVEAARQKKDELTTGGGTEVDAGEEAAVS